MKQYNITVNYTQGCSYMTFCAPPIVAGSASDALAIATDIVKHIFGSVGHVSLNAINSVVEISQS